MLKFRINNYVVQYLFRLFIYNKLANKYNLVIYRLSNFFFDLVDFKLYNRLGNKIADKLTCTFKVKKKNISI